MPCNPLFQSVSKEVGLKTFVIMSGLGLKFCKYYSKIDKCLKQKDFMSIKDSMAISCSDLRPWLEEPWTSERHSWVLVGTKEGLGTKGVV